MAATKASAENPNPNAPPAKPMTTSHGTGFAILVVAFLIVIAVRLVRSLLVGRRLQMAEI